jgi:hypothetical protein
MENLALQKLKCRKCGIEKIPSEMARGCGKICKACKNQEVKAYNSRQFGKTDGKRWGTLGNYSNGL